MRIRIRLRGKDRLCIEGAGGSSCEADSLVAWLSLREDVRGFEQRATTGVFFVHYDDGHALPGRFVRALREEIARIEHSCGSVEQFRVERAHSVPGRVRLQVSGLDQENLARLTAFGAVLDGVERAIYSSTNTILIVYDATVSTEQQLVEGLCESSPADWPGFPPRVTKLRWGGAVVDSVVLAAALSGAFSAPVVGVGVVVCMLRPLRRSLRALTEGTISIDLLDVVATGAALATGLPATAAFVIWMVGVGDLLLDYSTDKARTALAQVMRLQEREVFRVVSDETIECVRVDALEVGDRFVVGAGHSVAADGIVLTGAAAVNEGALTGESRYVDKLEGSTVLASTLVVEGELVVEVLRAGKQSEAAKILGVLSTAGSKPLTLQNDALRFAGKLVAPTFGVAIGAAQLARDIYRAVSVLITDFGTGVRIAVPTSALASLTLAAREGVLVKGAQYLERLARADVVVFDKTGTLTLGVPEIVELVAADGFTETEVMVLAGSAERRHDHPVAKALKNHAARLGCLSLEPELGVEEYAVGRGLTTVVDGRKVRIGSGTWMQLIGHDLSVFGEELQRFAEQEVSAVFIEIDDELAGIAGYRDTMRPESAAIVERLRAGGRRKTVLLSGDTERAVEWVSAKVGVDEGVGGLSPQDKADFVRRLRAEGHVVAMIGDGINDAPALALADVGVSIAGSTEVAVEIADVVLLEGGLTQLAEAFDVSDSAMNGVRRGLATIVVPNAIAIALGAAGLINPPLAAIINNSATVASVLVGTAPLTLSRKRPITRRQRELATQRRMRRTTVSAAAGGWMPFLHDPILLALYVNLLRKIAQDHGLSLTDLPLRRILRTIENALAARHLAVLPVQWIPGVTLAARAATAATLTEILGRYMIAACRDGENVPILTVREFLPILRRVVGTARRTNAQAPSSGAA